MLARLATCALEGDVPAAASAITLFTDNQYEEALETLLRAESLLLGTREFLELGTVYNSIGRVYPRARTLRRGAPLSS
jgi:hypothetical protein